jgi:hypothetical protein
VLLVIHLSWIGFLAMLLGVSYMVVVSSVPSVVVSAATCLVGLYFIHVCCIN